MLKQPAQGFCPKLYTKTCPRFLPKITILPENNSASGETQIVISSCRDFGLFHSQPFKLIQKNFHPTSFNCLDDCLRTIVAVHFLQNITYMVFNGFFTNI